MVVNGASRGNYLTLETRAMTIGRDDRCDMQVLDAKVSRRHVQLSPSRDGPSHCIEDLSSNGVIVNDEKIDGRLTLHDNDEIIIGDSRMVYTLREFNDEQAAISFAAHGQRSIKTIDPIPRES